jgi:SAM-dependent methyltransferase
MNLLTQIHPFQLINRFFLKKAVKKSSKFLKGKVLDLGCGRQVYKKYVTGEYHSLDLPENPLAEIKHDLNKIPWPIQNESYDCVLCTQVIDDFAQLDPFVKEIKRILKKNGACIITCSFVWELHSEPNDYYRLTEHGLKNLFLKKGFKIRKFSRLGNYLHVIGQTISAYLEVIARKYLLFSPFFAMFSLVNSLFWLVLGLFSKEKRLYLLNYLVAIKN